MWNFIKSILNKRINYVELEELEFVQSLSAFVYTFGLDNDFKRIFKTSIEDWNYPISDYEAIEILLKEGAGMFKDGLYTFIYDGYSDGFIIYRVLIP